MLQKKYFIGLDMGTDSVGWAVTDPNYNLLRAKGKDMWGIREFDEAAGAAERRTQRVSRRRRDRQVARIGILKTYFADAIDEVDPNFFVRLENSKYFFEDKDESLKSTNCIFDDPQYTDKNYYEQYPTIFHLRKELIWNRISDKHDVRLVFLALLNMFKHRGHFLDLSMSYDDNSKSEDDVFFEYKSVINEMYGVTISEEADANSVIEVLKNKEYNRSSKVEMLMDILKVDRKNKELIKMLCGLTVKAKSIFPNAAMEEDVSFSFSAGDIDEKIGQLTNEISEDEMSVIEITQELYNIGALAGILNGNKYLSDARVESYEEHKKDLKNLKEIFIEYGRPEDYDEMFRGTGDGTYSAYVKSSNSSKIPKKAAKIGKNTVARRGMAGRSKDDFYKTVKSYFKKWDLNENSEDERVRTIIERISNEQFMPKQMNPGNGVIPNQVHAMEMKRILHNAEKYLSFLKEKDESGLSVSERILKLYSFQIPYYVGPTSEKSSKMGGNGWVVRKEEGQVLPWNIDKKIDMIETRKRFIERMVRDCTYITGEKVLPKASLLYEKYCVLNEINNIRIDEERLSPQIKQELYEELYQNDGRVTRNKIIKWLINRGIIEKEQQVSGIDININNKLSSYCKFYRVFGDDIRKDVYKTMIEDIIYMGTVYGNSKNILRKYITDKYSDKIDEKQLNRILGFKFKDWTRLSKAFVEMKGMDKSTGENLSLIQALWDSDKNMMELINSAEYTFAEELQKMQKCSVKTLSELKAEDLEDMYFPAPVRKMIWQTMLILKEIETNYEKSSTFL